MILDACQPARKIDHFEHHDLINITTPVSADKLEQLCIKSNFCPREMKFLVQGFRQGFYIQYQGPTAQRHFEKSSVSNW